MKKKLNANVEHAIAFFIIIDEVNPFKKYVRQKTIDKERMKEVITNIKPVCLKIVSLISF